MSLRLDELNSLWSRQLEGQASAAEAKRLAELLEDPVLVDELAEAQAKLSSAEPAEALSASQWTGVDDGVALSWKRFKAPLWATPAAWAVAAGVGMLGLGVYMVNLPAPPQAPSYRIEEMVWEPSRSAVEAEEEPVALAPSRPRPQAVTMPKMAAGLRPAAPEAASLEREISGNKISFRVEQPSRGSFSMRVKDSRGRVLRTLYDGSLDAGKWRFEWDGSDAQGHKVGAGHYQVEMQSSGGHLSREVEIRTKK
jgi:hypothetical protein